MASRKDDKKELMKLLDDQQQQLERYEKRFGDLVAAYKSLRAEKKALESSLSAINNAHTSSNQRANQCDSSKASGETATQEEKEVSQSTNAAENVKSFEEQISTLTQAMTTLTHEKSRMEGNFQADKKKLKLEKEELEKKCKDDKQEFESFKSSSMAEIVELKKKIWNQQMEREKEHSDHAVMLRELQTLVAIERSTKEQLELQIEDLHRNLDRRLDFQQKCVDYQNKIKELTEKLDIAKVKVKESVERADQPQPLLLKLQKELESLKEQHTTSLIQERCRANEAEEQLQSMAQMSEERVANLELKLSELSETVGNYDRIRHHDQQAINGLKERVAQLDRENSILSGAVGLSVVEPKQENRDEDSNLDVQTLMGRIVKIKSLLHAANLRSENPVDLKEFLVQQGLSPEVDHSSCQEELGQLKAEFERYKFRAQSVLKNKNNKESSYSKEEESLKRQVIELRNKLKQIMNEMEEKESHNQKTVEELSCTVTRLKQQNSEELARCQIEYRGIVSNLENEMQKHRTRTIVLLEEKESEIKRLKLSLGMGSSMEIHEVSADSTKDEAGNEADVDLRDSLTSHFVLGPHDGQLLHYVQEISRKDLEVASLRRKKHQIETAMRELQTTMISKEEKAFDEIEVLRNQIYRLERNVSREGANLEYLKNVVLNYMLSSDANSRHHMLNAIATLLKFSPKELSSVQQYNKSWWWQHAPKPNEKHLVQ